MVLLLALVALLLISAVGAAILFMSATESALVGYQRTTTRAYESALGGLDEGRARLSTSDPAFLAGAGNFTLNFPARQGDVLYIVNPATGEDVRPWIAGNAFYDWEYVNEFGAAIETVPACTGSPYPTTPVIPCRWAINSDMVTLVAAITTLPRIDYKWIRITILTEQAAGRDINGDAIIDNLIPVTWDSISNSMNILTEATVLPATLVDRDGDGVPEARLDTDGDGIVEVRERLGRYVYRITAMSRVASTGATRMVQYDVSAPFVNLDFPSAVTLVGPGTSCGDTLGVDGNAGGWGPSNALDSQGQDQAPGAPPTEGGPAIGCTDPATCVDCSNELIAAMRAGNWTGIGSPECDDGLPGTPCTGDITAQAGPLGTTGGLQFLIQAIRNNADLTFSAADTPPQDDGNAANDTITYTGGALGTCDATVNQPRIVVFDGDVSLSATQGGCGILLTTGRLNVGPGNWSWKGIILVLGEGVFETGGTPSMQGAEVVARIYCQDGDAPPCPCAVPNANCLGGGVLAQPEGGKFLFKGGGTGGWDFNSLYINNAFGGANYRVLAYREMTQ